MLNTNEIIAKHFEGDPANAVRAHAAVQEILRAQADARPVAWLDPSKPLHMPITSGMKEQWLRDWPEQASGFSVPLFTAPPAESAGVPEDAIEAAAKKLAEDFDYPWEHMPTQGRNDFREKVRGIAELFSRTHAADGEAGSPFKQYTAFEHAGQEASERTAKLHEYLAQTSPKQAAQQQTNQGASHEWDASGERCLKCGDKDWFAGSTCSGKAAQQQAEPESVIKRQAQKIGELIADRDSWIEAHARLYRLYHDQSPKAGEEIHVNVEGGDVYTLPLQRSGMDKPRFVVHVPRPQQAEPGADERAAFEAWASKRRMDLRREANNPDEYLLASTADAFVGWQAHAAQSGQRAGVAELREIADNITANAVTQPKTNWGDGYRQACADIAGGLRLCANAAPTQQEGK
nr:hypothetical protein [Ralstonia mannitolilytica]